MRESADLVIAGSGPVGAALALALRDSGLDPVVLDARPLDRAVRDPRPIALSHGSRLILERLEVWDAVAPVTPIEQVHVSQQQAFGRVVMTAGQAGMPALGYVVEYAKLLSVLRNALRERDVRSLHEVRVTAVGSDHDVATVEYEGPGGSGAVAAGMVIVADGGTLPSEAARVFDYHQSGLVASVRSERPHCNVAFERFTPRGPLALLPCRDELALIWSLETNEARIRCEEAPRAFLDHLHDTFGARLGAFTHLGPRSVFPLSLRSARPTTPRTLYVGNASQTLHPVAGQGLNLGLRDAWEVASEIRNAGAVALGSSAMLAACRRRRRIDRGGGMGFTDALVRVFSNDFAPLRFARGAGLALIDALPPAKDFVVRRMIFGARG